MHRHVPLSPLSEAGADQFEELLTSARAGDAEALAKLFRVNRAQIERQARRFVRSDQVDDVISDTFVAVWQAIRSGAGPVERPVPYLMYAVRATAWRHNKIEMKERDKASRCSSDLEATSEAPELFAEDLAVAVRSLPARFRQVIWWTQVEGLTPKDVGAHLGLSANAAAALSYRARGALRRAYVENASLTA